MRVSTAKVIAGLMALVGACACGNGATGASGTCALPAKGPSATEFSATLTVGRTLGSGCEGVGGTPFETKGSGVFGAMATWSDRAAVLKLEIWEGNFDRLIATASPLGGDKCVSSTVTAKPQTLYVVRVCHDLDSKSPAADHQPVETQTPYQLSTIYP